MIMTVLRIYLHFVLCVFSFTHRSIPNIFETPHSVAAVQEVNRLGTEILAVWELRTGGCPLAHSCNFFGKTKSRSLSTAKDGF